MMDNHCPCGHYARTLAGARRHARTCAIADARRRNVDDQARVADIQRAASVNRAASTSFRESR